MLRSLLADRFHLVVHHEDRDLPIFVLGMNASDKRFGLKLREHARMRGWSDPNWLDERRCAFGCAPIWPRPHPRGQPIKEQLGMRLESTRGPVDVLVIDHAERPLSD